MHLFEEKKGKINIYCLTPNYEKVQKFKAEEIKTIPENQRVLKATGYCPNPVIKPNKINYSIKNLIWREPKLLWGYYYHTIVKSDLTEKEKNELLEKYISTAAYDEDENLPHTIFPMYNEKTKTSIDELINDGNREIIKNIEYFLCTSKNYEQNEKTSTAYMDGIIKLTEPLFLYQLLLQNRFDLIDDSFEIDKQVGLFVPTQVPIQTFDIEEVKEFDKKLKRAGIENEESNYEKLKEKVTESEKVLRLVKNINN